MPDPGTPEVGPLAPGSGAAPGDVLLAAEGRPDAPELGPRCPEVGANPEVGPLAPASFRSASRIAGP